MSKLGAHVTTGSRDGYGRFVAAKPALVVAVNEGGALVEAREKSGGHTVTVFRTTVPYVERPSDLHNPPGTYRQMAEYWYPLLREQWAQNPGDYYCITNEQGGGEGPPGEITRNLQNLIAYEQAVMELANADGYRVCVLNLATGSPGDFSSWSEICAPFIKAAWAAGNIYGRHVYGQDWLVDSLGQPVAGNASRPVEELAYLQSIGGRGGLAITECGLDGGYAEPDGHFFNQMCGYERALRIYNDIIGLAMWNLGSWQAGGTNWQGLTDEFAGYMSENPSEPWTPPGPGDPPPGEHIGQHKAVVVKVPQLREYVGGDGYTREEYIKAAGYAHDDFGRTLVTSHDDAIGLVYLGNEQSYIKVADKARSGQREAISSIEAAGYRWEAVYINDEPEEGEPFRFEAWPTDFRVVTQRFGARPEYYGQFGLPGHDGTDIRAPAGYNVYAVAAGTVSEVHESAGSHNYGIFCRVDHADGYQTTYAHLQRVNVRVGQQVSAGQVVGLAGATGNATVAHLHLTLKKFPEGQAGWPYNIIDSDVFLAPFDPAWPAGGDELDMARYFLPAVGDYGPIYIVANNWGGGDERVQLQRDGDFSYVTKNSQWEKRRIGGEHIDLVMDTSPGEGMFYRVDGHWLPRVMAVGETFTRTERAQFFRKADCSKVDEANWTTEIRLQVYHETWIHGNAILDDVVELAWLLNGEVEEWYWYAANVGLVRWRNKQGRESHFVAFVQGQEPNRREEIRC